MRFQFLLAAALVSLLLAPAGAAGPTATTVAPATAPASDPAAAPATATAAAVPGTVANPQFRIRPADAAWRAALPRDAAAATQAYLDRLPPDVVARANAYAEGGYWLQLWKYLAGLAVAAVLLGGQRAARVRDWAQRKGRSAAARDALFGAVYSLAGFALTLPLTIYEGFVREHAYGMATQNFAAWMSEQLVALAVDTFVTALAVATLYAVLRRAGERWWLWGALASMAMLVLTAAVAPVWIDPLFNSYKPVADGEVKMAILAMAHANGVPADNVYEFDASRQTTRISANVSGLLGTASVRLNDNLLRRTSMGEIRAVMAHELGHYVMNHIYKAVLQFGVLLLIGFGLARWAMRCLLARHGERLGLQGIADVASLPLLAAVLATLALLATPINNSLVRTQEIEADRFGLNLARDPHGFAEAFLRLAEYRKPDPGPIETLVFFHHPSTRARIYDAMRWREAMGTP